MGNTPFCWGWEGDDQPVFVFLFPILGKLSGMAPSMYGVGRIQSMQIYIYIYMYSRYFSISCWDDGGPIDKSFCAGKSHQKVRQFTLTE